MSNLQQSDLILAGRYVDGDLSAHEVAAAESRIATDADFAAAVEQIRQQSSLMKGLPKFKPTDDLADRTLQASMDQVKAFMGAWPVESSEESVTSTPSKTQPSSDGVDWKSTAALVASLAGMFLIGTMIWQSWNGSESNIAMNEAPAPTVSAKAGPDVASKPSSDQQSFDAAAQDVVGAEESVGSLAKQVSKDAEPFNEGAGPSQAIASRNRVPEISGFSGTPMKTPAPAADLAANVVNNKSAPVEQIWCVSQDRTAARNSVSKILQLNRIEVQLDPQKQAPPATPDAVEAFYVAATPGQMKLAMSQLSNNADIEMIQLPGGDNSPIADAIQQQFAQSGPAMVAKGDQQQIDPSLPERLQQPATNALAQQLVSNSLPRSMPSSVPAGPAPPILKSGTPIEGLGGGPGKSGPGTTGVVDLAMSSRSKKAAVPSASPAPNEGGGFGGMGGSLAEADEEMADTIQAESQQRTFAVPQQLAEFDKYLDDSDQQLRQYLILVRSGEAGKK